MSEVNTTHPIHVLVSRGIPEKYRTWVKVRNVEVANILKSLMASCGRALVSVVGKLPDTFPQNGGYAVLSQVVRMDDHPGICTQHIFGVAAVSTDRYDKTAFHRNPRGREVENLLDSTSAVQTTAIKENAVESGFGYMQEVALPGYSFRSEAELEKAVQQMLDSGYLELRLKSATESDGGGQKTIFAVAEARDFFQKNRELFTNGGVVEPALFTIKGSEAKNGPPSNVSVGFGTLPNGENFCVVNKQVDIEQEDGNIKYGGGNVVVVKGDLSQLEEMLKQERFSPEIVDQIRCGISTLRLIRAENPQDVQSFVAVDVLKGLSIFKSKIVNMVGAVDISPRVTGATPAVMEILELFNSSNRINTHVGGGCVRLHYGEDSELKFPPSYKIYLKDIGELVISVFVRLINIDNNDYLL